MCTNPGLTKPCALIQASHSLVICYTFYLVQGILSPPRSPGHCLLASVPSHFRALPPGFCALTVADALPLGRGPCGHSGPCSPEHGSAVRLSPPSIRESTRGLVVRRCRRSPRAALRRVPARPPGQEHELAAKTTGTTGQPVSAGLMTSEPILAQRGTPLCGRGESTPEWHRCRLVLGSPPLPRSTSRPAGCRSWAGFVRPISQP